MDLYSWVKSFHVISIIAWMAALLYLPRLFVYHSASMAGSEQSETFKIMERRLLRAIMTPAMASSWLFGIWLAYMTHAWVETWFAVKFAGVAGLSLFHLACARWVREFACEKRERSQRFFRFMNEIPTLAMILIVVMVIVKPF